MGIRDDEEEEVPQCGALRASGEKCCHPALPTGFCSRRCAANEAERLATKERVVQEVTQKPTISRAPVEQQKLLQPKKKKPQGGLGSILAELGAKDLPQKVIPQKDPFPPLGAGTPLGAGPSRADAFKAAIGPGPRVGLPPPPPPAPPPQKKDVLVVEGPPGDCPICLTGAVNRRLDCAGSHEFCSECVNRWRVRTVMTQIPGTRCPICRQTITTVLELEHTQKEAEEAPPPPPPPPAPPPPPPPAVAVEEVDAELSQLLEQLSMTKYEPLLKAEEITNLAAFAYLTVADLKSVGLPLGPALKLKSASEVFITAQKDSFR